MVRPLVRRLALSQPASVWAEVLLAAAAQAPGLTRAEALACIDRNFSIQTSVDELVAIYAGGRA